MPEPTTKAAHARKTTKNQNWPPLVAIQLPNCCNEELPVSVPITYESGPMNATAPGSTLLTMKIVAPIASGKNTNQNPQKPPRMRLCQT